VLKQYPIRIRILRNSRQRVLFTSLYQEIRELFEEFINRSNNKPLLLIFCWVNHGIPCLCLDMEVRFEIKTFCSLL
jgi:hypothetical protein